jgi:hypothetical protein
MSEHRRWNKGAFYFLQQLKQRATLCVKELAAAAAAAAAASVCEASHGVESLRRRLIRRTAALQLMSNLSTLNSVY